MVMERKKVWTLLIKATSNMGINALNDFKMYRSSSSISRSEIEGLL